MSAPETPITIVDQHGKPYRPERPKPARPQARRATPERGATYDAARDAENANHWLQADGLSASAANSPAVRYKLRTRARYEVANNGYAAGLVRRRANDTVGVGPRLQLSLPETFAYPEFPDTLLTTPADAAERVERLFAAWCESIGLADKLRTMDRAESVDGEAFAVEFTNPTLPADGVQLDLRLYECDQVSTPDLWAEAPDATDGVRYDAAGNPTEYHFLKQHPGDAYWSGSPWEYDRVPAARVYHLFEQLRPGQRRGIPPLAPGLPLYAVLRRYTYASLHSAEWGACIAGVMTDESGPPGDADAEADDYEAMDTIPIARNSLLYLGRGRKANAFDSKQPSPGYREFKGEVLTESGRSISAPRNVSTGSSAEYNYSSGRLDHLPWQGDIGIRRENRERCVLDRLFRGWLREAAALPGYLPDGLPPVAEWEWAWRWPGFPSIDPVKDATAKEIRKQSGLLTDAEALAEEGRDWREHYKQLAREKALRVELGIDAPLTPSAAATEARTGRPDPVPGVPQDA